MAGEVHPVPFRTRKLSPPAPMVLRGQPVGEQVAADRRRAFAVTGGPGAKAPGASSRPWARRAGRAFGRARGRGVGDPRAVRGRAPALGAVPSPSAGVRPQARPSRASGAGLWSFAYWCIGLGASSVLRAGPRAGLRGRPVALRGLLSSSATFFSAIAHSARPHCRRRAPPGMPLWLAFGRCVDPFSSLSCFSLIDLTCVVE